MAAQAVTIRFVVEKAIGNDQTGIFFEGRFQAIDGMDE
jgi:hypothetical protein